MEWSFLHSWNQITLYRIRADEIFVEGKIVNDWTHPDENIQLKKNQYRELRTDLLHPLFPTPRLTHTHDKEEEEEKEVNNSIFFSSCQGHRRTKERGRRGTTRRKSSWILTSNHPHQVTSGENEEFLDSYFQSPSSSHIWSE